MSGLAREPFSRICFTSEPHRPENVVRTRTQSEAGSGSSSTSSSRTGATRETNARRSTRPPIAEAASRARLCRNTSAFTFALPGVNRLLSGSMARFVNASSQGEE